MPTWAEQLDRYQRFGLRLFYWERTGDPDNDWKKAVGKAWNRKDLADDFSRFDPAKHNVGTITGSEIKPGHFLADVDLDWTPPRELFQLLPASEFTFGHGKKPISHAFFTTPERLPSVKEYKDIDGFKFLELFGGDFTQYTMVPPSLRAPEAPLVPVRDNAITHIEVAELHRHLRNYAIAVVLYRSLGYRGVLHELRLAIAGFLLKEGMPEDDVQSIGEALTMATGNDVRDWTTAVRTTLDKLRSGDNKVTGRRKLIEVHGDTGKKIVAKIKQFIGNSEFHVDQHGRILADNTENIRTALEKLDVDVRFDAFAEQLQFQRGGSPPTLLDDRVSLPLRFEIEEQFHFRPPDQLFTDVLKATAYRNPVHPVREWLDALRWDGEPRIDTWLVRYGSAADTPFTRSVSAKVLIAAVRRVREPGCKFDEMLVLESPQGKAKSTAIQTLCPDREWFSDSLPLGVDAQKVVEQTSGKWIVEASELHGNRGKEAEHLKAFLSRGTDGPVRLAYHHFASQRKRQFILIGTTNKVTGYLKDPTGGRRFWPVRIEEFDIAALQRDRNQLWAEAAEREARGESIRLEQELWAAAAIEQEDRRQEDPWEDTIRDFTAGHDCVPTEPLWAQLNLVNCNQRKPSDASRIAEIMQLFGFTKKRRVYVRDESGHLRQKQCWVKDSVSEGFVLDWQLPFDHPPSGEM